MLHWICPECGNECEPSDRDCPSCYPPDPSTARQWRAATIAAPPPLPVTPPVVVREPVAIPAFLIPVEDPGSDVVRTLKLPIPVLAPPSQPRPVAAAAPPPPEQPPVPVPAGLAALSHLIQARENTRVVPDATRVEPFPPPVWNAAADSVGFQYSWTSPGLDTAARVPQPQRFEFHAPPSHLKSAGPEPISPAAAPAAAFVPPGLALDIVPDEIRLPEPEPPVEQDPAFAGPASWTPAKPAHIAPPRLTGVAAAIQLAFAPWASVLRVPFHDASPERDAAWVEHAQRIQQIERLAGGNLAPLTPIAFPLLPRDTNLGPSAPLLPVGYAAWPFQGARPALRPVRATKFSIDSIIFESLEKTVAQAIEQFDATASRMAGLLRLPIRLQFRKGFTATGYWLNREPEAAEPLPPQGSPVTDYRVPMDRAVLAAIEEERKKALELVAPPAPAPKPPANTALVPMSAPRSSTRNQGPFDTVEILHPIIETPVPAMAKLLPLPLFGLRPKQSNPRPRHVALKSEFPPPAPFIPMRSVRDVPVIPSPIYKEKRPKTYKPAMPQLGTGSFRQPSTSAGWLVTAGIALLIPIAAVGVVNYWILPAQRASAASSPSAVQAPAAAPSPSESRPASFEPAAGQPNSAAAQFNWRKSLQLTGIRMLEGGRVQFLVVNIGKADIPPSSVFQVTLRSSNPKPGEPPIGSFQVRLNAPLSPREARDLITPITLSSQLRPDADLNDLRIEMQPVSSPVAVRR